MLFQVIPAPVRSPESHAHVAIDATLCTSDEYLGRVLNNWTAPRITDECHPALHFYTTSRFALHNVIVKLIQQTGPAHVTMCTYSLSEAAIHLFARAGNKNMFMSLRIVLDSMRAQAARFISAANHLPDITELYHYSMHAKVALIQNDNYAISVVMSANASNSGTIERGAIFTQNDIITFDANELHHIISRATRFTHRTGQNAISP